LKKISVIIPALNEVEHIKQSLQSVQFLRGNGHEVIVVDGGSDDETCELASNMADQIITLSPGRAIQMNAGAKKATGDIFVFLHADTILPDSAEQQMLFSATDEPYFWGRFKVRLSGKHWLFRIIEFCMNLRTCLTGIVTGDHALFVSKQLFNKIGGFPEIELMEDIVISRKLKKIVNPVCLHGTVLTSSRRWEKHGIIKTVLHMWWLRFKFVLGVDPLTLTRQYD
jgi:rSAM/selenodomain-associated transferase 2